MKPVSAAVVLEHKLRQALSGRMPGEAIRVGLGQLLATARRLRLTDTELGKALIEVVCA